MKIDVWFSEVNATKKVHKAVGAFVPPASKNRYLHGIAVEILHDGVAVVDATDGHTGVRVLASRVGLVVKGDVGARVWIPYGYVAPSTGRLRSGGCVASEGTGGARVTRLDGFKADSLHPSAIVYEGGCDGTGIGTVIPSRPLRSVEVSVAELRKASRETATIKLLVGLLDVPLSVTPRVVVEAHPRVFTVEEKPLVLLASAAFVGEQWQETALRPVFVDARYLDRVRALDVPRVVLGLSKPLDAIVARVPASVLEAEPARVHEAVIVMPLRGE